MTVRQVHEVLVVGAGPTGSYLARQLAQAGHDVALIDENTDTPRCRIICSGIVSLEASARFDLPRDSIITTIEQANFYSPGGLEVSYRPKRPLAHVVDRTRFDGALIARAVDAGATLLRGYRAAKLEVGATGVRLNAANGDRRTLLGKALVIATGYRPALHKQAGLGSARAYVQGVHVELPFHGLHGAEVHFGRSIAPGCFAWAVPAASGMARLGLMVPQGGRGFLRAFLAMPAIQSRLRTENTSIDPQNLDGRVLSRGIVQGPIEPSVADRVIAIGEAAGQVKTTTGGGLYYGLIGAELAAEVLGHALRQNRLSSAGLQRYEQLWRGKLVPEIEIGFELQRLGAQMNDQEIDELFRSLQSGLASGMKRLVRFDWHKSAIRLMLKRLRLRRSARHEVVSEMFE